MAVRTLKNLIKLIWNWSILNIIYKVWEKWFGNISIIWILKFSPILKPKIVQIIRYHIKESWMKRKDTKCQINLKITIIKIKNKNKKQKTKESTVKLDKEN